MTLGKEGRTIGFKMTRRLMTLLMMTKSLMTFLMMTRNLMTKSLIT